MKEFIKRNIKMIVIVIGILSLTGIVAYATGTYVFESTDVRFDNTNTEITAGDVQGALEEVYHHVTDYNDIKDIIGSGSLTTTSQTLIGAVNGLNDKIGTIQFLNYSGNATSYEALPSGLWRLSSGKSNSMTDKPSGYTGGATYVIKGNDQTDETFVKVITTFDNKEYIKYSYGVWGNWHEVATTDQIANLDDHNAVFRGKSLGSSVTSAQWTAISSGTFNDLYVGDYWTINGVNWRIAGFDIYINKGDTCDNGTACKKHHAVIVPDTNLTSAPMNDANITTDGYVGSKMYTDTLPTVLTTIRNAFGTDHVLKYRALLTNSVNTSYQNRVGGNSNGASNSWEWYDAYVNLMNMVQVTGNIGFSSSGYDTGTDNVQFPLFRLKPEFINKQRSWYWVRDVATSARFALVFSGGSSDGNNASYSGGVRPYFYIG